MKKIHILIADDHALMRVGLNTMLKLQHDMTVVGEAANGERAVELVRELRPDVAVLDLVMPGIDGAEATRLIRAESPETRVLILTSYGTAAELGQAIANGATGVQLKGSPPEDFLAAVRDVAAGKTAIASEVAEILAEPPALTPRQREVLQALVRGLSNDEIAEMMGLSRARIKQHLNELYTLLGAANRTEATALALKTNLISA